MTAATPRIVPLQPASLRRRCDPSDFSFTTTAELTSTIELLGQQRARVALTFGLAMSEPGFNICVAGPAGTGKTSAVRTFLEREALKWPAPNDWCYVHNFHDSGHPRALSLPAGRGRQLRADLRELVAQARREIPRAFESEHYVAQREQAANALNKRREQGMEELVVSAQRAGFTLRPSPAGMALIPTINGQPLSDEQIAGLRPEMRAAFDQKRAELEEQGRAFFKAMLAAERETRQQLEAQDRQVALDVVGDVFEGITARYAEQPAVTAFLAEVREAILADIGLFRSQPLAVDASAPEPAPDATPENLMRQRALRKYEVNVLMPHDPSSGVPVVFEPNPTYANLIGRIEREAFLGALVTDATLITPGALHKANGGYLVLRAEDLLRAPMAWEALKRALRERAIDVEDPSDVMGLTSARSLQPDRIPLDIKILLLAEQAEYHLLYSHDSDFRELFKVRADFGADMDRNPENEAAYAAIAGCLGDGQGLSLSREGAARVIEESSRLAEDQRKLSARFSQIADLVREAGHWARVDGATVIGAGHVRRAVEQRIYRSSLVADRLQEMVTRGILVVRPEGSAIGQIHGLAVINMGDIEFGRPSRITATIAAGRDGVLDIERQVELGGPIHSKGVLILAGYLGDLYAQDKPLALSARIVFEQSYEGIEGDSASVAETLALLSRLADAPLDQGIAVTGSINQRGEVQAVGGVNQKIEGFFDTCLAMGLTGKQGVILPASNVQHLMLRDDVVAAVEAGRFQIYAAHTVDEALELLTGQEAGPRAADGTFPAGSIHARVNDRLIALADAMRDFATDRTPGRDGPAARPTRSPRKAKAGKSTRGH